MDKPDDIPQDVWDATCAMWSRGRGLDDIARAILAATASEREACALVLDAVADKEEAAWQAFIKSNAKGPATSFAARYRGFAEAIRHRDDAL